MDIFAADSYFSCEKLLAFLRGLENGHPWFVGEGNKTFFIGCERLSLADTF